MPGALRNHGLRVKSDPQPSGGEHREIVRSVAHRDRLLQRDVLLCRDFLEVLRLALGVDDFAFDPACQNSVLDFEVVGADVVDAEFALEVFAEVGEAAGDDGGFVSERFEGGDQAFGAFRQVESLGDGAEARFGEALEHGDALDEGLVEIQFAAHRGFCEGGHFVVDIRLAGQFVDHLVLDERGIHIERNKPTDSAIDIVALPGDVDRMIVGRLHQGRAENILVLGLAPHGKLDARPARLPVVNPGRPA